MASLPGPGWPGPVAAGWPGTKTRDFPQFPAASVSGDSVLRPGLSRCVVFIQTLAIHFASEPGQA